MKKFLCISQDSVATPLRYHMITSDDFYFKFASESHDERIDIVGQHLAKLWEKEYSGTFSI